MNSPNEAMVIEITRQAKAYGKPFLFGMMAIAKILEDREQLWSKEALTSNLFWGTLDNTVLKLTREERAAEDLAVANIIYKLISVLSTP